MLLVTLFVISCGASQSESENKALLNVVHQTPDTTFGPGDLFDIRVYGEKELSNTFRVASTRISG